MQPDSAARYWSCGPHASEPAPTPPTRGTARSGQVEPGDPVAGRRGTSDSRAPRHVELDLIGIDRSSGEELWTLALERPSALEPRAKARPSYPGVRTGALVLVPVDNYGIVAVDVEGGAIAWERDLQLAASSLLVLEGRLHVSTAWRFLELDAATGATIADTAITDPAERRATGTANQIAHHDGVLYTASLTGTVFGWSFAERRVVWVHEVGARVEWSAPPQVFLDTLWIMDAAGALHPFDLAAG